MTHDTVSPPGAAETAAAGAAGTAVERVGAATFRALMAGFPSGVGIVTTIDPVNGRPWGLTCSSICSASLDPPTVLVCLRTGSPTLAALLRRATFAVNLLHSGARSAAELFASGDPLRFDKVRWVHETGLGGPHLVDDAHAVADCHLVRQVMVGDHVVAFGEVVGVEHPSGPAARPLLYGERQYVPWPLGEGAEA